MQRYLLLVAEPSRRHGDQREFVTPDVDATDTIDRRPKGRRFCFAGRVLQTYFGPFHALRFVNIPRSHHDRSPMTMMTRIAIPAALALVLAGFAPVRAQEAAPPQSSGADGVT